MTGYKLLSRRDVGEYRVAATHLRHEKTGCEVLHLAADDTENLFAFCFATPPRDDTGVSHILEHSVLSGSKRYPLKEPFSALLKSSLKTFLNALTYPDRTVYPGASCTRADFFNLLSVYGDAVFFPLLRRETFMQEAWRLEPAGEGSRAGLQYAGVVYNEMKGAYSSPDSIVGEWMYRSLFPDTPYCHDSGGDPKVIPTLTHEALLAFHARYYHPSNCRVFLYGDIPLGDILGEIDRQFLSKFAAVAVDSSIPLQPRWKAPRRLEKTFPVQQETPLDGRSTVSMSWLLPPVTDPLALVANEVLSEVLVGSAGSPLRKALIDSGLGEDLSPVTGFETDLREGIFAVGLRGTDPSREAEIQGLILDTLSRLASGGLDEGLVQSVVNRTEFRNREIRGSGGPYALRLMGRTLRGWTHGMDPVDSLAFAPAMEQLKARLAKKDRYLEGLIRAELLDSPHRVTLVVRPDPGQEARDAEEAKALLAKLEAGLSSAERERILAEADSFRRFQLAPDSPEAAATLPTLRRTDLRREVERIPCEERPAAGGVPRLLLHDIFTNGIVYLDLCVPLAGLTERQTLLLPLFGKAVCGCGLPGRSYSEVSLDLFRLTGGFSAVLDAGGIAGRADALARHLVFRARCLHSSLDQAVDLVANLLGQADFQDLSRLRDLVLEHRNSLKAALVPSGHLFASLRAGSMISASVTVEEQWKGVTQLAFVQEMSAGLEKALPALAGELDAIRKAVLRSGNLLVNATAAGEAFPGVSAAAAALAARLPGGSAGVSAQPAWSGPSLAAGQGESLSTTSAVGFAAQAIPGFRYEDPRSGLAAVLGHLLTTGYLWEKVRMEGGAYGVFAYPRNLDGLFLFGSYRDPKIGPSLKAYRESLRAAGSGALDEAEVEQALIGTIGNEDRPLDPGEKGFASLQRHLHGLTDGMRQARRDALLAVTAASLAQAASQLLAGWDKGACAAIAGKAALADAARDVPELAARVSALPE